MASVRYRYIGETPVNVPDMNWGYDDKPVMPGDVSLPHDGEINSEVIVPVGSSAEKAWLASQKPAAAKGGDA